MEAQYEQPHQEEGEAQREPAMEFEAGPQGFLGGLMSCRFYRTSVNIWYAGYDSIKK